MTIKTVEYTDKNTRNDAINANLSLGLTLLHDDFHDGSKTAGTLTFTDAMPPIADTQTGKQPVITADSITAYKAAKTDTERIVAIARAVGLE